MIAGITLIVFCIGMVCIFYLAICWAKEIEVNDIYLILTAAILSTYLIGIIIYWLVK